MTIPGVVVDWFEGSDFCGGVTIQKRIENVSQKRLTEVAWAEADIPARSNRRRNR
jgi:hypothetical protein